MMADKRRRRPITAASSGSSSSENGSEFHVVAIGETTRRRSDSAARNESWMTKVTTAMSQRLFTGKRLGASRSTQVMPMMGDGSGGARPHAHSTRSNSSSNNSSLDVSDLAQRIRIRDTSSDELCFAASSSGTTRPRAQTLRQVSSENALARSTTSAAPAGQMETVTSVPRFDAHESVATASRTMQPSGGETIHVQRKRSEPAHDAMDATVCPRARDRNSDSDDELDTRSVVRNRDYSDGRCLDRHERGVVPSCGTHSRHEEEASTVQAATPILKDFFSRSASTAKHERERQRACQRDRHYRDSRERQQRLRRQQEEEELKFDKRQRSDRIDQLRRMNLQRRVQLRVDAARVKRHLQASGSEHGASVFAREREQWELALEDEIRELGDAFRRCAHAGHAADDRPMTVAGLAVPEALCQLERDRFHSEKRASTAPTDSMAGTIHVDSVRVGGGKRITDARAGLENGDSSEFDIFRIEESLFGCEGLHRERGIGDMEEIGQMEESVPASTEAINIQELLSERDALRLRLEKLEEQVRRSCPVPMQQQQQGFIPETTVYNDVDSHPPMRSEDSGFFI